MDGLATDARTAEPGRPARAELQTQVPSVASKLARPAARRIARGARLGRSGAAEARGLGGAVQAGGASAAPPGRVARAAGPPGRASARRPKHTHLYMNWRSPRCVPGAQGQGQPWAQAQTRSSRDSRLHKSSWRLRRCTRSRRGGMPARSRPPRHLRHGTVWTDGLWKAHRTNREARK